MSDKTVVDPAALAAEQPAEPAALESEIDRIAPDPGEPFPIANGHRYRLQRLRTRQFMRLLRVLTAGAGPMLVQEAFQFASAGKTPEQREAEAKAFAERFLTLLMLSIPEAEDQTLAFIKSMILPEEFVDEANLTDAQRQRNSDLLVQQEADWHNPEIEDTVAAAERIVRQEAKDLYELGNRLGRMWNVARKTGQTKDLENAVASAGKPATT
jgi:hypothetical protein